MKTLKLTNGAAYEVAITSSESSLAFVLESFAACDPIVKKIALYDLASLDDQSLSGKAVSGIQAQKISGGVLLTISLQDVARQQTIDNLIASVADNDGVVPDDLQKITELARKGRDSLADADATVYADYFPAWSGNEVGYTKDQRIQYGGKLYKVLQAHTSQSDWTPDKAASLFAAILPGQSGTEAGAWVQPGSTNPYMKGNKVTHGGYVWTSLIDNNVWEPSESQPTLWSKGAAV